MESLNLEIVNWSVLDQFESEMRLWNDEPSQPLPADISDSTIFDSTLLGENYEHID